jgi:glycosyltransferase involved in cell wall biosynthesis
MVMSLSEKPELSVVIPLYNEVESVEPLYEELHQVLDDLGRSYEVIIIDDGSRDGSFFKLKAVHERDSRWRIIRFRRNFGKTAAYSAGFAAARGELIMTLDADLQNDPNDIPHVIAKMDEGFDIVSGWRMDRKEPFLSRRLPSMIANRLISRATGVVLHDYGCALKIYRAEVVKNIHLYGELHRFVPALASWMGVTVAEIKVNDRARKYGKSKFAGIDRTIRVFLDLATVSFLLSYSQRPAHIFGGLGVGMSIVGVVIGLYMSLLRLMGQTIGDRPLLLLAVVLVIVGVQMASIGLVAEIVVRTYYKVENRPTYVIREQLDDDVDEREYEQ